MKMLEIGVGFALGTIFCIGAFVAAVVMSSARVHKNMTQEEIDYLDTEWRGFPY